MSDHKVTYRVVLSKNETSMHLVALTNSVHARGLGKHSKQGFPTFFRGSAARTTCSIFRHGLLVWLAFVPVTFGAEVAYRKALCGLV